MKNLKAVLIRIRKTELTHTHKRVFKRWDSTQETGLKSVRSERANGKKATQRLAKVGNYYHPGIEGTMEGGGITRVQEPRLSSGN